MRARPPLPLIVAFLTGLVSATALAPLSLWPLMIAAFAVLIRLLDAAPTLPRALAIGWWFGFGQFVLGLNWIATAFIYQAAMPAWLGWLAVVLLSLYLAVYPALAAGVAWRWAGVLDSWTGRGRDVVGQTVAMPARVLALSQGDWFENIPEAGRRSRLVLLLAAMWIVTEWLRATMFTGFAWNPVGVIWITTPVRYLARAVGTYGLSGLTVLGGGFVLLCANLLMAARTTRRRLGMAVAAILVPVAAALALMPALTRPSTRAANTGLLVHIVQPNIDQDSRNAPDYAYQGLLKLARLSQPPPPATPPRLLLWPEAAVEWYLDEEPAARAAIAQLLRPGDLLLTGGSKIEHDAEGRWIGARNSLWAMDAGGRLLGRYDKAHLVPYGEYLPMRPLLSAIGLSRLVPGDLDYWEGPGPRTLTLPGFGAVGVQICYEIIFSGHVIDPAHRPGFLFNPSNDAWFGAWGPPQHLAQARLRAAEEGMTVVRSTLNGVSAVIAPDGTLVHTIPRHVAGTLDLRLPASDPPTLFARYGNALPFGLALLLALAAIALRPRSR